MENRAEVEQIIPVAEYHQNVCNALPDILNVSVIVYSDFAMIGHTSGLHVPISVLNQRLNRPLVGIAAVQNNSLKDALTVCQVN